MCRVWFLLWGEEARLGEKRHEKDGRKEEELGGGSKLKVTHRYWMDAAGVQYHSLFELVSSNICIWFL